MYRATTYCQDFPDTERYDYGSAYGQDRASFLDDLRKHLTECASRRRRVVNITVHTPNGLLKLPTYAEPGQLPNIDAVLDNVRRNTYVRRF